MINRTKVKCVCKKCGFLNEITIRGTIMVDSFGVSTKHDFTCKKCGEVQMLKLEGVIK